MVDSVDLKGSIPESTISFINIISYGTAHTSQNVGAYFEILRFGVKAQLKADIKKTDSYYLHSGSGSTVKALLTLLCQFLDPTTPPAVLQKTQLVDSWHLATREHRSFCTSQIYAMTQDLQFKLKTFVKTNFT